MSTADKGKDTPSDDRSATRQIARRLIHSRRSESAGDTPARAAAAACDNLYDELSRWVGPDGCHALFARALAQARTGNAALEQVHLEPRSKPYVDGVAESIIANGDPATGEAIESMLSSLIELLGRLIGDDMAMKLIERSLVSDPGVASVRNRREEA